MDPIITLHVIYSSPVGNEGWFVLRRWTIESDGVARPDEVSLLAVTIEEAREMLPPGLQRTDRRPWDVTRIAEVWT